jgi:hypothetical protein
MERAAGFLHTSQAKLDKLDAVLAQTATSKQDAALFAEMLLLSNDGHYPPRPRSAQRRQKPWKLSHPKCKCWRGKNRC